MATRWLVWLFFACTSSSALAQLCPLSNGVECDGQGSCVNGVCSCYNGFGGDDCSLKCATNALLQPCSGHGQCGATGVCACDPGWAGDTCEQGCPGGEAAPCSFRGECISDGRVAYCVCEQAGLLFERYEGIACQIPVLNVSVYIEEEEHNQPQGNPGMLALPLVMVIMLVCAGLYFHEDNFFGEVLHGGHAVCLSIFFSTIEIIISSNILFFNLHGPTASNDDDRSDAGSDSEQEEDVVVAGPIIELESIDSRKELEDRIKAAFLATVFLRDQNSERAMQEAFVDGLRMLGLDRYMSVAAISRVRRQLLRRKQNKSALLKKKLMSVALRKRRNSMDPAAVLKEQFRHLALECHRQMLFLALPLRSPVDIAQHFLRTLRAQRAVRRQQAKRHLKRAPSARTLQPRSPPSSTNAAPNPS